MTELHRELRQLARRRWGVALALTLVMVLCYFGFILLIAFNKRVLARLLAPGLSLGIVSGALVIVVAWLLTLVYVRWANRVYDPALDRARRGSRS